MSKRSDADRLLGALRARVPAARKDPQAHLEALAADFEDLAEGPEDDARVVRAARATAKALGREAERWRRTLG